MPETPTEVTLTCPMCGQAQIATLFQNIGGSITADGKVIVTVSATYEAAAHPCAAFANVVP